MLENWCWRAETLKALSNHWSYGSPQCYDTWKKVQIDKGQPLKQISDEMLEKLIASRNVNGALFQLVVLQHSIFDMAIHQPESHEALQQMDFELEWVLLGKDLMPFDREDTEQKRDNGFLRNSQFVNDGDYDAGFYSYLL
jgi:metallopeptidase MepB